MSVAAKVYNRMLLDRIYEDVSKKLRPNQAGFRRRMNCLQQIHIIRRIMEGARDKNLPLVATFVDFSKAFDSMDTPIMWRILRSNGIPESIVAAIRFIYSGSCSRVRLENHLSVTI